MRKLFLFLLALTFAAPSFAQTVKAPDLPPGVIIDKSDKFQSLYIGSPSIEILPDGTYVASHDFFGPDAKDQRTQVFESKDRGETWTRIGAIENQRATYLFNLNGALYAIGWRAGEGFIDSAKDTRCAATIARSLDGGHTWTVPTDSKTGVLIGGSDDFSVFCDPAPVLIHNGRVWKELEQIGPYDPDSKPRFWMTRHRPFCASAPVDCDLLDASNWTFTEPIKWTTQKDSSGWAEGNVLFTPEGKMIIQMRVDDAVRDGKGAQIQVSDDGKTATFDPETGFVEMPGGTKKFVIKYDEQTKKYWSIVNWIHPDDVDAPDKERTRNTSALVCSSDLKTWEVRNIIYRYANLKIGFQYVDWRFDGDDLACVCRLAWKGAHNCHDANYFTFFRLKNFRSLTRDDDAPTWVD